MEVDYFTFIAKGEFGMLKLGTPWEQVIHILGVPPLYEPPGQSTPAIARYGILEFIIVNEQVSSISLQVDEPEIELPVQVKMINFGAIQIEAQEVKNLLQDYKITWKRFELFCDEWTDYYLTSTGVHLAFGGDLLGKVGAADPHKYWGVI